MWPPPYDCFPRGDSHRHRQRATERSRGNAAIQTLCWTHMGDDRHFARFLAETQAEGFPGKMFGWFVGIYRGCMLNVYLIKLFDDLRFVRD